MHVADSRDGLGASGVFRVIVDGARKIGRAVTGGDHELTPEVTEHARTVARAFIAGRFGDVHALGTKAFVERTSREQFAAKWSDGVRERGPLTGFKLYDAGQIDLHFIPGLEAVPQSQFVAFIEITFSSPNVAIGDDNAFTIGVVLLDEGAGARIGALHAR
jgi:hypothetical protein